jgi:hypothetical protein
MVLSAIYPRSFFAVQLLKKANEIYLNYLLSQSPSQGIEPGPNPVTTATIGLHTLT